MVLKYDGTPDPPFDDTPEQEESQDLNTLLDAFDELNLSVIMSTHPDGGCFVCVADRVTFKSYRWWGSYTGATREAVGSDILLVAVHLHPTEAVG